MTMKFSCLIVLILGFSPRSESNNFISSDYLQESSKSESISLGHAIYDLVARTFSKEFNNVRIIYSVSEDFEDQNKDLIESFIKLAGDQIRVTVESANVIKKTKDRRISGVIIIIDTVESFENSLKEKISYDNIKFRKYHVIVVIGKDINGFDTIFQSYWDNFIVNVVLVANNNGKIKMVTFFPFTGNDCTNKKLSSRIINEFDNDKETWENENFFMDKVKNLNHCEIRTGCLTANYPSAILEFSSKGNKSFSGFEVDIVIELARIMNASLKFSDYNSTGSFLPNHTITSPGLLTGNILS